MTVQAADILGDSPVLLAPMAGITDLPFRRLAHRLGAALVVSEMVASHEMVRSGAGARSRAAVGADAAETAVQLAGRDPGWMAEAARIAEAAGARIIDINMGCPAKKVVGGLSGAALMREPDHALRLVDAVVDAVSVPVTVKMRLGWDMQSGNAAALAERLRGAGVGMITIHGRTRCQFYKGRADWRAIRAGVAAAAPLPVIANGDVTDAATARAAMAQSGAAGVMIGRAARGRPWLPAQIAAALSGRPVPATPAGPALSELVAAHYEAILAFYGTDPGLRCARKHLGWYMQAANAPVRLRRPVMVAPSPQATLQALSEAFAAAPTAIPAERAA